METLAVNVLLVTALAAPVVLFLLLVSRFRMRTLPAAALAIAAGWALDLAYAYALQDTAAGSAPQGDGNTLAIAAAFGWACPAVLVFLAWLGRRVVARRAA